jgi:hypothetical protein
MLERANVCDIQTRSLEGTSVHVWQGLVNRAPDVDAIWRLGHDGDFYFPVQTEDVFHVLDFNVFCPFNSQSTLWVDASTFPFLYLPSTVSFRFSDILRSYVASFGIWHRRGRIGFTPAVTEQQRNPHRNFDDFLDEMSMYGLGSKIYEVLARCDLKRDNRDLLIMYRALAREGTVGDGELSIVDSWIKHCEAALSPGVI